MPGFRDDRASQPMTNFEAREHLSAYLDGELSGDVLVRMEEALEADAVLRADLGELREVIDGLGALPEMDAPEGLFSAVMADVAGLAIPIAADLATESAELAPAPAPRVIQPPPATPGFWESILNLSWWLKGPAMSAAACLLVVGVVFVTSQDSQPDVPPTPVALRGAPSSAESAPVPSGVLAGDDLMSGDALADLGVESDSSTETARFAPMAAPAPSPEPLLAAAEPTVLSGVARPDAPPPIASSVPARSATIESAVGPEGVYEALHEDREIADASDEPSSEPEGAADLDAGDDFDGSVSTFAPDEATVADREQPSRARREDRAADSADLTMDGEPLEDWLDPPADDDIVADGRMASAESAKPGTASSVPKGKAGGPVSLDEVTFTGVASSGVLVVTDRASADQLVQTLRSKGWTAAVSAEQSAQLVLDIRVPSSAFAELRRILASNGSLSLGGSPAVNEGQVQLRLSVAWGS
jgi:hypothetical protein